MAEVEYVTAQDLNNSGVALCTAGDYIEGIKLLRKAQASNPDDPDLCCSLAHALIESGDTEEVYKYLDLALALDPEHVAATAIIETLPRRATEPKALSALPQPTPAEKQASATIRPKAKRFVLIAFALIAILLIAGLIGHRIHKSPIIHKAGYIVSVIAPDTQARRESLLGTSWSPPFSLVYPDSVRVLPGYFQVTGFNSSNVQVGVWSNDGVLGAFSSLNNQMTSLPPLSGDSECGAMSINNSGKIVGYSGSGTVRAVLWSSNHVYDLNQFVPADDGLNLRIALLIGSGGVITATGIDKTGNRVLVSLTPTTH